MPVLETTKNASATTIPFALSLTTILTKPLPSASTFVAKSSQSVPNLFKSLGATVWSTVVFIVELPIIEMGTLVPLSGAATQVAYTEAFAIEKAGHSSVSGIPSLSLSKSTLLATPSLSLSKISL